MRCVGGGDHTIPLVAIRRMSCSCVRRGQPATGRTEWLGNIINLCLSFLRQTFFFFECWSDLSLLRLLGYMQFDLFRNSPSPSSLGELHIDIAFTAFYLNKFVAANVLALAEYSQVVGE